MDQLPKELFWLAVEQHESLAEFALYEPRFEEWKGRVERLVPDLRSSLSAQADRIRAFTNILEAYRTPVVDRGGRTLFDFGVSRLDHIVEASQDCDAALNALRGELQLPLFD